MSSLTRKAFDRLKAALDQDPVLNEIAIRAGIEAFCVVGPAADGHAITKRQVLQVGFRATRFAGETLSQADRRVVADAMDMAARVGQLLEVSAAAFPLNGLDNDVPTFELFGVTTPRAKNTDAE